jgi:hypothetical protein
MKCIACNREPRNPTGPHYGLYCDSCSINPIDAILCIDCSKVLRKEHTRRYGDETVRCDTCELAESKLQAEKYMSAEQYRELGGIVPSGKVYELAERWVVPALGKLQEQCLPIVGVPLEVQSDFDTIRSIVDSLPKQYNANIEISGHPQSSRAVLKLTKFFRDKETYDKALAALPDRTEVCILIYARDGEYANEALLRLAMLSYYKGKPTPAEVLYINTEPTQT